MNKYYGHGRPLPHAPLSTLSLLAAGQDTRTEENEMLPTLLGGSAIGYDSPICQEFSLTSFSLSSMYFPSNRLRIVNVEFSIRAHLPCISASGSMP